jgi:hypothetical protein
VIRFDFVEAEARLKSEALVRLQQNDPLVLFKPNLSTMQLSRDVKNFRAAGG